jgi:hypothetical protein
MKRGKKTLQKWTNVFPLCELEFPRYPKEFQYVIVLGKLFSKATSLVLKPLKLEVKLESYKPQKLSNS